ncbi:MAG: response regulator [Chloroflexales bacterium]
MVTVNLFLVDAHRAVRAGLKTLINAHADMTVIGEAGDGASAWQAVQGCRPDVVIMDSALPAMSGIQVAEQIGHVQTSLLPAATRSACPAMSSM